METGIELIKKEREEQINKHQRTIESDVIVNKNHQLPEAASFLVYEDIFEVLGSYIPEGWDVELWSKMCNKPYKERLVIAGALIAAEIDRI